MLADARAAKQRMLVIEILIFCAVFLVSNAVASMVITPAVTVSFLTSEAYQSVVQGIVEGQELSVGQIMETVSAFMRSMPTWLVALQLYATALSVAVILVFCLKLDKRTLLSLGLQKKGAVPEYLAGIGVGFLLFSFAVVFCWVTGKLQLEIAPKIPAGWLVVFFVGFMIQGFSEELLCRSFLMTTLSRGCPLWVAVGANSLLFALLHLGNSGVSPVALINLTMFGVFASFYTLRRGSLWGIAAVHSVWNFVQGNVYGIPVSGIRNTPSILNATLVEGKLAGLINGGDFGLEGGIGVTLTLSLAIGVLLILQTKRSELQPAPASPDGGDGSRAE